MALIDDLYGPPSGGLAADLYGAAKKQESPSMQAGRRADISIGGVPI